MRLAWVVVCLLALTAVVTAAPTPSPPPNPEIVYVEQGNVQKIVVINSDGSNKTPIFGGARGEILNEPVISTDAGWVAFTSATRGLVLVDRISKAATLLMTNADCGSGVARLPNDSGLCWNPRFSPTGSRIAVIDGGLTAPRVWSVPTTGGTPVVLYVGTQGRPLGDVAWDSDETQIAVVERNPTRIVVINLSTGATRIVVDDLNVAVLDWARNGINRIIFDALIAGGPDRDIYTVDFSGTSADPPVLITSGMHPSYSPDNGSIVFRKNGSPSRISKHDLASGVTTNLATGNSPEWKR